MNKDGTPHGNAVPTELRFWKFVDKAGPDECWLWNGNRNRRPQDADGTVRTGHAMIQHNGSPKVASRVCWELVNGPIPEGMCVCHKCDVPLCVNPAHLFLGTKKDNTMDAMKKGRYVIRKGEAVNTSKMTAEKVKEARASFRGTVGEATVLACKYRISLSSMCKILSRQSWKHLD